MTVLTHEEARALKRDYESDLYELIRETEELVEKKLALRAQPDHIVDASKMVDHSELVKAVKAAIEEVEVECSAWATKRLLAAIGETK